MENKLFLEQSEIVNDRIELLMEKHILTFNEAAFVYLATIIEYKAIEESKPFEIPNLGVPLSEFLKPVTTNVIP